MSKYQQARNIRREGRTIGGTTRGGKLTPVMAVPILGSESGSITQTVTYELDPIAGRMITDVNADIVSVFVPLQAMDAMARDTADFPGNEDALRALIVSGQKVFGTEGETELSQRCGVVPRPTSGYNRVSTGVRYAHNCAVNFLRQRKFVHAPLLDKNSTAITPALIGQTVLDRLNGVLDPEDRVNGAVQFGGQIKVSGIAVPGAYKGGTSERTELYLTDGEQPETGTGWITQTQDQVYAGRSLLYVEEDPNNPGYPNVRVDLADGGSTISLTDMYQAERMDQLTREMRKLVDDNPQFGEELVARYAYGLSVDVGRQPFVIYEKTATFGKTMERATDGASLGNMQSNLIARHQFTAPIPRTEFGGVIVTFVSVRPDETLATQPHPVFSRDWAPFNFVADELAIDPEPVIARDLDSEVPSSDETNICLYTGRNELYRNYINYGFARNLDPTTVENKTAIWQLKVPMSVTPESILYPEELEHYPFKFQDAEVCRYTVSSLSVINTPITFGPTPVEELAVIENEDIFQDA